ncbi:hypothetical protein L486_06165 [Kwoniella mangroviensis CBS 10435]|uniref:Uncharacterized protein n=1 Tax=Kwoniella mangroviensis CBS 10435 TaxID=1331196 RepID=A0A1B9ILI2_9TREE|nr:hypothetical protein L486_06165 [Kwoniella mangroviensis CBS 10435]OCF78973.1 hypothetical protein I204_00917 [Kwoniella mangroviensis CBS 8886]
MNIPYQTRSRPGEIKRILDIIPLEPLGDLKGCRDIMVDEIHPEGVLGVMMDKIEGAKEGLEGDLPSLKDQDRMQSYNGPKKAERSDQDQYESVKDTSASDRLSPDTGFVSGQDEYSYKYVSDGILFWLTRLAKSTK